MSKVLFEQIDKISYTTQYNHKFLNTDFLKSGGNIGVGGENLTIAFLSLGRNNLTKKLCDSVARHIPKFKGEVLAIDNGNDEQTHLDLTGLMKEYPFSNRVIRLGKNYGVAGGRNRSIEHIRTEWVMFLDNDIYFTKDPLPKIQQDINLLGCKFINLPLLEPDMKTLFSFGGHLWVELDRHLKMKVGHGGAYHRQPVCTNDTAPELSTFLFGGASVLSVAAFKQMGCFDENMFVGFEDTDLSIRIFQAGMKIGTAGTFSLVHDHPVDETPAYKKYKKERYSTSHIENSAKYMEEKHSFSFWNEDLKEWLYTKHDDEEYQASTKTVGMDSVCSKKRIALVADTDNWAFSNIARNIERYLSDEYKIDILYTNNFRNVYQLVSTLKNYDLAHFFWRAYLNFIVNKEYIGVNDMLLDEAKSDIDELLKTCVITTSVYDHLFLDDKDAKSFKKMFSSVRSYSVSSEKLNSIYSRIEMYPSPDSVITDGVDTNLFVPTNLNRFYVSDRPLQIGWVGNSNWAAENGVDYKGVHTILMPALEILKSRGIEVTARFADRANGFIPLEEMPAYYSSIDVYVCPSMIEGTPNPVLEAMACGVPIISTDVGIVREALTGAQEHFIVDERTPEHFADAIEKLHYDRDLLSKLSEENIANRTEWAWETRVERFRDFFQRALKNSLI